MELSENEMKMITSLRSGHGIVVNANLGFMVAVTECGDGRVRIECPTTPRAIMGPAEAEHVRQVIEAWSKALDAYDHVALRQRKAMH